MSEKVRPSHIGLFTSGGDSPGMNAAIRAVVRTSAYHGIKVTGFLGGYDGLVNDRTMPLGARDVSNIIQRGGTMLRSARSEAFRKPEGRMKAKATLDAHGIEALIAIGGDGTFVGAMKLHEEHGVRTIGLPGTIDNDLAGTDYSIGFDTAANTAMQAIDRIRDTASSHDRLFFVEVMGRDTGFLALASGVAAGAEYVMVPEKHEGIDDLVQALSTAAQSKSSSIVVIAEGDEEGGAFDVARKVKEKFTHYDTRVSVIGHMQRGGSPTVNDRLIASRSGVAAVEALREGKGELMIGIANGKVVHVPFAEAIKKNRALDEDLYRILHILST
jgi:6-phosphofructokinase 1